MSKEYYQQYYQKNRKRILERANNNYAAKKSSLQYYHEHKEERLAYNRKTRQRRLELARNRRIEKRDKIRKIKAEAGCLRCKETDPVVLTFHHRDPSTKLFSISNDGRNGSRPWTIVKAEIAKCDVVCANCHLRIEEEKRNTSPIRN